MGIFGIFMKLVYDSYNLITFGVVKAKRLGVMNKSVLAIPAGF